jgi:N-acetylmuramoyl-L-alanine amidase
MGDIQISGAGIGEAASSWYQKSVEAGGAAGRVAQQRLIGVSNGTFSRFIPSSDLESPRLLRDSNSDPRRKNAPILVIDPGHGGADAGALGLSGEQEKEITLDVARRVKTLLEKKYGYRVYLTREHDLFVPLARRTAFANRKDAASFISLHVNASAAHDADGLEAYYLDNTNDEASRKLAERENGIAHGESLDDLSFMLSDLIQSGKLEDSIILTRSIEGSLKKKIVKHGQGLRSLGVKKGPFFVLVGAHMPCSLIEMFFIDHPHDGQLLRQEQFRSALATGIADGIRSFLERTSGN